MTFSDPFVSQYAQNKRFFMDYYYFESAFTDEEIEKIIDLGENSELFEGLVGGFDNIKRKHVRDSTVGFLDYDNNTSWVFEKMADYAKEANNEMWSFDLLGFGDGIQYTKYFGGGGHYDWHADIGETCSHRKISMVVQLSDETDYDGGILQLNVGHQLLEVPKLKGSLSIFPSYLLHRVTPVVTGVRKSLVSWVSGPNLR
jgi:PKHD-type hydroxylase